MQLTVVESDMFLIANGLLVLGERNPDFKERTEQLLKKLCEPDIVPDKPKGPSGSFLINKRIHADIILDALAFYVTAEEGSFSPRHVGYIPAAQSISYVSQTIKSQIQGRDNGL